MLATWTLSARTRACRAYLAMTVEGGRGRGDALQVLRERSSSEAESKASQRTRALQPTGPSRRTAW